jgi:hypothetical protein
MATLKMIVMSIMDPTMRKEERGTINHPRHRPNRPDRAEAGELGSSGSWILTIYEDELVLGAGESSAPVHHQDRPFPRVASTVPFTKGSVILAEKAALIAQMRHEELGIPPI